MVAPVPPETANETPPLLCPKHNTGVGVGVRVIIVGWVMVAVLVAVHDLLSVMVTV